MCRKSSGSDREEAALFHEAQKLSDKWLRKYNLTLNNIELVGLRRIAKEVLVEHSVNSSAATSFAPNAEVFCRFLKEFFDVYPEDFFTNYDRRNDKDHQEYRKRYNQMFEYLKMEQKKRHNL